MEYLGRNTERFKTVQVLNDLTVENVLFISNINDTFPTAGQVLTWDGISITWKDDSNTLYVAATSSTLGLLKIEDDTEQSVAANSVSATASRTYGIQFNASDQAVVNVPWTDTNTTYTAGDGLDLSGTTFSTDLKSNGGLVIESTELAIDLGASSITGTLAVEDGGTGLTTVGTNNILTGNGTSPLTSETGLTYDGANVLSDYNDAATASTNITGFYFDYDKSGIRAASTNSTISSFKSDMNDAATNNGTAVVTYIGFENNITNANATGALIQYGIKNTMSGADLQYGIYNNLTGASIPSISVGIWQKTDDAAMDIKFVSAGNVNSYFGITTGANGATTIKTEENGAGETAHLTFDIDGAIDMNSDGAITLDSGAAINLEPASGSAILLDGTVSVDGGSVTGITTLGVDSVSLTAVQTSGETFADNDTSIMTSASIDDRINAAVPTVPDEVVSTGTHIHKQTKVTLDATACNNLNSAPQTLVAAQGANTIIVPVSVTVLVDNDTGTADSSGADLIVGLNGTTSYTYALKYARRFMLGVTTDMTFQLSNYLGKVAAHLSTGVVDVPLTISTAPAITGGSLTSMTIYTSYYVIDNS